MNLLIYYAELINTEVEIWRRLLCELLVGIGRKHCFDYRSKDRYFLSSWLTAFYLMTVIEAGCLVLNWLRVGSLMLLDYCSEHSSFRTIQISHLVRFWKNYLSTVLLQMGY